MNKTVQVHRYPAAKLPSDLRQNIDPTHMVSVVVTDEERPEHVMSLVEILASRQPPYRTADEIDSSIRSERDSWDD